MHYILLGSNEVEAAVLRDVLKEIVPDQGAGIMPIAAEEWKAEGIQIGQAMGKAEGKADLQLRQLRRRFDPLPETVMAKVRNASENQLNEWADNILGARTLDMVFGVADRIRGTNSSLHSGTPLPNPLPRGERRQ